MLRGYFPAGAEPFLPQAAFPAGMPGPVDLHAHTTASDGSLPPRDLVRLAREQGLAAVALTDHDTLAGLPEALAAGEEHGVEVVPGIELSAVLDDGTEVHMLGYLLDTGDPTLGGLLTRTVRFRNARNARIVERLRALGCDITLEEVQAEAGDGASVGRPHLASVLVRKGYASSIQDAFDRYLAEGKAAHVPKQNLTPAAAIRAIHAAGGLAVLAHPFTIPADRRADTIGALARDGLDGLEVLYPKHDAPLRAALTQEAERWGLVATGGSDFHGTRKPDVALGSGVGGNVTVPYAVLEALKARKAGRRSA